MEYSVIEELSGLDQWTRKVTTETTECTAILRDPPDRQDIDWEIATNVENLRTHRSAYQKKIAKIEAI